MKKFMTMLLVFASVMLVCCGCGGKENGAEAESKPAVQENPADNQLLPANLKFGMSYEEAKSTCSDISSYKTAINGGNTSVDLDLRFDKYEEFYNIDGDVLYADMMNGNGLVIDPSFYCYFNGSDELYELGVSTRTLENERPAEFLFNAYVAFCEEKMGTKPEVKESTSTLVAQWNTETVTVRVTLQESQGDCTISMIVHSKAFE